MMFDIYDVSTHNYPSRLFDNVFMIAMSYVVPDSMSTITGFPSICLHP